MPPAGKAASTKRAKTETVSLRLDPKTKFMMEFMSRVQGRSITAIVEHAIRDAAKSVGVRGAFDQLRTWSDYWDATDGVRTLRLLSDANYPTSFDEDELLEFTRAHWEFFYMSIKADTPARANLEILWPNIEKYFAIWREKRQLDYWSAGEAMAEDLKKARLSAPTWPRGTKKREAFDDLDDEIPF